MKKILNFLVNNKKGQGVILGMTITIMLSLFIGLALAVPIFWMNYEVYETTWMNQLAPWFFAPFFASAGLMCAVFAPYLLYRSRQDDWKENVSAPHSLARIGAVFMGMIPGGMIYGLITKVLFISYGPHNLIGVILFGWVYVNSIVFILKRPFKTAGEFLPLY